MILEKKLIEKEKNKTITNNDNKEDYKKEKNNDINQSKMEYWKEAEEKNQRYKKNNYKGNYYYSNYFKNHNYSNNKHSNYAYYNKKHHKKNNNYKSHNFNYSNHNHFKKNYIEKEVELNSNGEEQQHDTKLSESTNTEVISKNESTAPLSFCDNYSITSDLDLNLQKAQSEGFNANSEFNLLDIGKKLFPGVYANTKYYEDLDTMNEKKYIEKNDVENKDDFRCSNFLCKVDGESKSHNERKNGLSMALEYYAPFLESKII